MPNIERQEIELLPEHPDFLGRALLPDPDYPVAIDAFDFRSVYRTSDNMGVSFVAEVRNGEGKLKPQRHTMALPDFIVMILAEEGRTFNTLTEIEKRKLNILGFRPNVIEIAEEIAISFNNIRKRKK